MKQKQLLYSVLFLFFLSGFSALIYQIVWVKWFGYVSGVTIYAVTTVVAAFMAGLALGSYLFGKYVDNTKNPLRIYILLELGIALYAISFPLIMKKSHLLYIILSRYLGFSFFAHSLGMFVLGFLLLLIPTTFMGATLPVLTKFLVKKTKKVGEKVGYLYALNTYGGVAGVLVSAFILIPSLGLTFTTYIAILTNLIIVLAFILINKMIIHESKVKKDVKAIKAEKKEEKSPLKTTPAKLFTKSTLYIILIAFGISGFASLSYEILWTRMLMPIVGIHVYSFAKVLAAFLFGIATGSLIYSWYLDKSKKPLLMFALIELFIGIGAVLSIILFNYFNVAGQGFILSEYLIIIIPTLCMGISFPLVTKILGKNIKILGRTIGSIYSVNTVGAIIGTFVAGFFLLELFGIQTSIFLIAVINFILALVILLLGKEVNKILKRVLAIVIILCILFIPFAQHQFSANVFEYSKEFYENSKVLYYKEGVDSTVSVIQSPIVFGVRGEKGIYMQTNGKNLGSNEISDYKVQSLLTHLPFMLHKNPQDTLFVGLGTGITMGIATLYPVKTIDTVEISAEVAEAAELFSNYNYDLSKDPRYNLIIDDARNYILKTDKKYDVISSEAMDPYVAGSGNLFTQEYFMLIKKRLKKDGVIAQWIPLFRMSNADFKMAIKTFTTVFPHTDAWMATNEIILISSEKGVKINQSRLEKVFENERIRTDLAYVGIMNSSQLLDLFLFNETELKAYVEDVDVINTDDYPHIEYSTPKFIEKDTITENKRSIEEFKEELSNI